MLELLGGGLVLLGAAAFIISAAGIAWCTVGPISRAGGALQAPTQFLLSDSLSLMVLLQVALAACGRALERDAEAAALYWILLLTAAGLMAVLWAAGVSVVSRAGIVHPLRRFVVVVVLVPGTLALIVCLPILVGVAGAGVVALVNTDGDDNFVRYLPFAAGGLLCLAMLLPTMRRLSFWVLQNAKIGTS